MSDVTREHRIIIEKVKALKLKMESQSNAIELAHKIFRGTLSSDIAKETFDIYAIAHQDLFRMLGQMMDLSHDLPSEVFDNIFKENQIIN